MGSSLKGFLGQVNLGHIAYNFLSWCITRSVSKLNEKGLRILQERNPFNLVELCHFLNLPGHRTMNTTTCASGVPRSTLSEMLGWWTSWSLLILKVWWSLWSVSEIKVVFFFSFPCGTCFPSCVFLCSIIETDFISFQWGKTVVDSIDFQFGYEFWLQWFSKKV